MIFVITTDGYENSSSEYTAKMVRKMIKAHQEQGWQFIFMGANIDAVSEAEKLGISGKFVLLKISLADVDKYDKGCFSRR